MTRRSPRKGADGEREWRDQLRAWGIPADRLGYLQRDGLAAPDVACGLPVTWEVKRRGGAGFALLYGALEQARGLWWRP